MKVLLVGGGGREHALAWKVSESPRVDVLFAAPGNPGIARHAKCVAIAADAADELLAFAEREGVDLTIVGPEAPLVAGLVDRFAARGLLALGPGRAAAALEGSKAFAKTLMARHGIPTARFSTFADPDAARRYCAEVGAPLVVKADGLAAGKGVVVCPTLEAADDAIEACLDRRIFGSAGATVVIEEFLSGDEVSFFALANGKDAVALAAAQDHKTVFDGDRGPNTGGMGAYSPVATFGEREEQVVMETIVRPALAALSAADAPYRGVLFAGLMMTVEGPKVIEFNCRWGDPECQAIVSRAADDVVPLLWAAARGDSLPPRVGWRNETAVCVSLASGGYPGTFRTGLPITGLERAESRSGVRVFHAGTAERDGRLLTAGGRVLGVTATAPRLGVAIARAYEAVRDIHFEGMHYRTDIGGRALGRAG